MQKLAAYFTGGFITSPVFDPFLKAASVDWFFIVSSRVFQRKLPQKDNDPVHVNSWFDKTITLCFCLQQFAKVKSCMLLLMRCPYKRWVEMIHGLVDFCHWFLQVSNMYAKAATSSEQCFKGTFAFNIEDPKSTFVRRQSFCVHLCRRIARSKGNDCS